MDINNESKTNDKNNVYKIVINKILKLLSNKILLLFLAVNIILIFIIIYLIFINQNDLTLENSSEEIIDTNVAVVNSVQESIQQVTKIKVHITGEVKKSGIYELEEDSRISDIIEKAGGITSEADLSKVNLAYQIADGQKIIIPSIKQENNGNYIIEDSGENIIEEDINTKTTQININKADISELTSLPGIGEATAEKIINYRTENGKFKNIEELKNVSGIGENKYNQLKDYIKVK